MDVQALAPTVGIAFAALISAVAYLYKNRMESKRSARKVLYYLLEIRYSINTSLIDAKIIYDQYINQCLELLPTKGITIDREQLESLIGKYILEHLVNITESIKTDIDEAILTPYEQALLKLSETNPILAYRLRGKERIQHAIAHTTSYCNVLETEVFPSLPNTTDGINNAIKKYSKSQKNDAFDGIENTFNDEILMVAKNCGFFDYIKCKKILRKSIDQNQLIDPSDFHRGIDEFFGMLIAEATKAKNQPTDHTDAAKENTTSGTQ